MGVSKTRAMLIGCLLVLSPASIQWEPKVLASSVPPARKVHAQVVKKAVDPRVTRLRQFLTSLRCPVRDLAGDFVQAADENHLDWRLLPSISIIESGGGKAFKNNNIFGWDNCETGFPTIRTGIRHVAFKLARLPIYRNKSSYAKLRLYNPDEQYAVRVQNVMFQISPVQEIARRQTIPPLERD